MWRSSQLALPAAAHLTRARKALITQFATFAQRRGMPAKQANLASRPPAGQGKGPLSSP